MPKIFPVTIKRVTSGGGTTGNLRWGPNYGNNERATFGARALIAVNEYRQITQKDLLVACSVGYHVDVTGLLTMLVTAMLSIFFTLVFLYTFSVAAAINLRAIALNGFMRVAALISFEPTGIFGLLVAASLAIFFTLTFLYTFLVGAAIAMSSIALSGGLQVAATLTGQFSITGYNLLMASAIRMVNPALAGALQVAAFITVSTIQIGSLTMGTVAARISISDVRGLYELRVASAIRMVALAEVGLLRVATALTGALQITSLNLAVASRISIANEALVLAPFNVAAAIRETALSSTGLLSTGALIGPVVKYPEEVAFLKVASALVVKCVAAYGGFDLGNWGTFTWTCPTGVTAVKAEAWGSGGAGGAAAVNGGGGGGAGGFGRRNALSVTPGNTYTVVASLNNNNASGSNSSFTGNAGVVAQGNGGTVGVAGTVGGHGAGGAGGGGTGDDTFTGGAGGGPNGGVNTAGGGGGGGAGSGANGSVGGAAEGAGGAGGAGAGTLGGIASDGDGGPGGAGGGLGAGGNGLTPGGGGGGASTAGARGQGAPGQVLLTFTLAA